jgi:hypothetical protein
MAMKAGNLPDALVVGVVGLVEGLGVEPELPLEGIEEHSEGLCGVVALLRSTHPL